MMTCKTINAEQAEEYFEHPQDYYTRNLTNFDRWYGSLANAFGLTGELSKEQFDNILTDITKKGRTRAGVDCTFSAPKSVSIAMAKNEDVRIDMIAAHQAAVARVIDKIELELLQTRSDGNIFPSRNAIMAEFLHPMARPTERNNYVPDLDLHSHVVILNKTFADGKDLSLEYGKITDADKIKELGLMYRQELAKKLQAKGYKLEITDSRQGFFELRGFDRETIMDFSNRRKDILQAAWEHGIVDMQQANQISRKTKNESQANFGEVLELTKKALFDNGKVKIEHEGIVDNDRRRVDGDTRQISVYEDKAGQRGSSVFGADLPENLEEFAAKPSLSELPRFGVDDESGRVNLLLSESVINRLAKFQSDKVRSYYLLRTQSRRRLERIDAIVADTVKKLAAEKYAFSVSEAHYRIMAAGVLESITAEEADAAMERAGIVRLGLMERNGYLGNEPYLTTQENIAIEQAIVERVKAGKGTIISGQMTIDESRAALDRAEAKARREGLTDFTITDRDGGSGEQAEAVHHILTSMDKYVCVDGLAGTGKTTMMERLKWIADEQGITVCGVCFTGKAADGLEHESGIKSKTIHAFLNQLEGKSSPDVIKGGKSGEFRQEWDFSKVQKCQGREIWAVDEAGLVDMHLMNQLQKAAEARGAQVLLLGDPDQLPPVGAGEPMRQMEEAGMATAYLYDIRRQKDMELLNAVKESVQGDHLKTFETLQERGDYREVYSKVVRTQTITKEMTAGSIEEYDKNLLLVSTNRDRRTYNKTIREEYVRRSELEQGQSFTVTCHDGEQATREQREFSVKDRIIFTANDKRLGVMNGTMATIERIEGEIITARTDAGKAITWNMAQYDRIDYGYAVTNYKAQGMTVDKVVVDMNTKSAAQTRNALYVDISRARHRAIVYTDDKSMLERQTRKFAKKITSKDFARKISAMRRRGGITNNDRYHAPQDQGKALAEALAQIRAHTQPLAVRQWGDKLEAERREREQAAKLEQERQKAARLARAAEREYSRGRGR